MVAQRLVRKLCNECKQIETASLEVQQIIKSEISKLPKEILETLKTKIKNIDGPYQIYKPAGCKICKGKGTSGRIGLYEVLKMTRGIDEIINSGPTEGKLRDESRKQGMISLRQDGILKVLNGLISIEEVLKETAET